MTPDAIRFEDARRLFVDGLNALQRGDFALAEQCLSGSLQHMPGRISTLTNLAAVQIKLGNHEAALVNASLSTEIDAGNAPGWLNVGIANLHLGRLDESLRAFDRALAIEPRMPEALTNKGSALNRLRRHAEALKLHDAAVELQADLAEVWFNRGTTLASLGQDVEALESYERALAIRPAYAEAWVNKGDVFERLGRYEEALRQFDHALQIDPTIAFIAGRRLHMRMKICDWSELDLEFQSCVDGIRQAKPVIEPFDLLSLIDDPALQLQCARISLGEHLGRIVPSPFERSGRPGRIRIAYLSPDFRHHPVSQLIVELVESHDRRRFEVFGVQFGSRSEDSVGKRIASSFEHLIEVDGLDDEAVVERLRALQIDIAIDLAGHTRESRIGVFERRCAPVQVSYLGYPGTSGSSQIDYVIADRTVLPDAQAGHYSEQPVWMPNCFQPNDSRRPLPAGPLDRAAHGLPDQGLVFCAFGNVHKLNPSMIDRWSEILRAVPDGTLWLLADNALAERNLVREFGRRAIDRGRIVFAPRVSYLDYLTRYRLADLFLDTLPFNAGTTASDALWMGLPVLTQVGRSFAARMAASLLRSLGLDELIAETGEDYVLRGIDLAREPARLKRIRKTLDDCRATAPLFDGRTLASPLEEAFVEMVRRWRQGLPASPIYLSGSA